MASFNTTVRQMTELFQRKKNSQQVIAWNVTQSLHYYETVPKEEA